MDIAVEDMRAVDPIGYIQAVGLRPEDSYGFLPLDLSDGASFFFLYRDRPEYAQARAALPEAQKARSLNLGVVDIDFADGGRQHDTMAAPGPVGQDPSGLADMAANLQQQWGGAPGGGMPPSMLDQLRQARDMGLIDEQQFQMAAASMQTSAFQQFQEEELKPAQEKMESERQQVLADVQADMPAPLPVAAGPADAPAIVAHRVFPEPQVQSSSRQLDHFLPPYCQQVGLCPEDVYGVFPRQIRTNPSADDNDMMWEDYWIVYRDRPEYAQGRQAWTDQMNAKLEKGIMGRLAKRVSGDWPEAQSFPGVAEAAQPGSAGRIKVEKERWPREKLVVRKRGPELGDALRKKIGGWGYRPEDSFGFCPDYDNGAIYFAWRKP